MEQPRRRRLNQKLFTVMVIAFAVGSFERHIFQTTRVAAAATEHKARGE